jgi:hypothetical protein
MSEKATLRIRFSMNQNTGKTVNTLGFQRVGQRFAAAVVREVGLRVAEDQYRKLVGETRREIAREVEQEIQNIARLYARHVPGRGGVRNTSISLQSQTLRDGSPVASGWATFPPWKPLADSTVRRKGHSRFFQDRNNLAATMRKGSVWMESFGPIQVSVSKIRTQQTDPGNLYKDRGSHSQHFVVGRISVFALSKITPAMLPELAGGVSSGGGRAAGLVDLISDSKARVKIGGWNRSGQGAYRPSLEPFLAFALTRSIPQAIFTRIKNRGANDRNGTRRLL